LHFAFCTGGIAPEIILTADSPELRHATMNENARSAFGLRQQQLPLSALIS
jgi:hypothetical protein